MLSVCSLVLFTGAVVTWLAYRSARSTSEALVNSLFREVSAHAATHTHDFVLRAGPVVESLRHLGELGDKGLDLGNTDRLAVQLLAFLQGHRGLTWVNYGDENGTFTGVYRTGKGELRVNQSRIVKGHTHEVEYRVLRDGTWREARKDNDSGFDPRNRPWYDKAKKGRLVWVPPYVFSPRLGEDVAEGDAPGAVEQTVGITCAAAVRDRKGKLRGVVSVDLEWHALSDFLAGLSVSEQSRVFLFTADKTLLAHPNQRQLMKGGQRGAGKLLTLADTGDALIDAFGENLRPEYLWAEAGDAFHPFEFRHDGTEYLASATTFPVGDDLVWVVGVVAPKGDFLSGVWRSQALALGLAAAALLVAVLLAVALARRVSGPVLALIGFMRRVGDDVVAGNPPPPPDFPENPEFRQLSDALKRMIADLRDRQRLRHSIDLAAKVEQQLLPSRPPTVRGLDVAGYSKYCDETGGDYYDFLIVDEAAPDRLLVAVGDVMGHGVAAALVMAGTRAVLRDRAGGAGSLPDLFGRLNRQLVADLKGDRFMTMHLSVIDARAGTFRWVSAGHDPALMFDPAADRFEEIDEAGLPLGIMDDTEYAEQCYGPLRPGQVVLVGTDGIWEMLNAAGEQFGKKRLRDLIRQSAAGTAEEISQAIRDSLAAYRGDCRPVDDVTFVVIKVQAVVAEPAEPAAAVPAADRTGKQPDLDRIRVSLP
jgi:phosphoserine phosphatase RsbU/P